MVLALEPPKVTLPLNVDVPETVKLLPRFKFLAMPAPPLTISDPFVVVVDSVTLLNVDIPETIN